MSDWRIEVGTTALAGTVFQKQQPQRTRVSMQQTRGSTKESALNRREADQSTEQCGMHRVAVHRLPVQDVQMASTRTVDARSNVCTDTEKSTANCRHNDAKVTPTTEKIKELGTAAKIEKSWHCSLKARVAGHRLPIAY